MSPHSNWKTVLTSAGIILACAMAGLAIGVGAAYHSAELRLSRYATRLLQAADTFNQEIDTTLKAVNASPDPICSEAEFDRLRTLVFHAHFVKDIGRIRDGKLICTSMAGRLDPPRERKPPELVTATGLTIHTQVNLVGAPGMFGVVMRSGNADVVASSDAFGRLREAPMGYTTILTNQTSRQVLRVAGDPLRLSKSDIFAEKELFRDHTIYLPRCSARFGACVVVAIALRDALQVNDSLISGFIAICTFAGLALAILLIVQPGRRSLATQLRRALRLNLLTVVYQPIVEVRTGRILGVEGLARWTDEDGEYVRPDVFIAAAEELGFINRLTRVVLKIIVDELGVYLRANPSFTVNVNISAADLADPEFLPMLERLLLKHKIAPQSINLELTERSTANNTLAISRIGELRQRGHAFYLDDFGTGYSTFSYLNQLHVDAIKIDRAFTDAIGTTSLTAAIVPQILEMARALKVKVVIEGVERAEQSDYFAGLEQEILAQGWHFGEPVPVKDLLILLQSKAAKLARS